VTAITAAEARAWHLRGCALDQGAAQCWRKFLCLGWKPPSERRRNRHLRTTLGSSPSGSQTSIPNCRWKMNAVKLASGHSLTRLDPAGGEAARPSGADRDHHLELGGRYWRAVFSEGDAARPITASQPPGAHDRLASITGQGWRGRISLERILVDRDGPAIVGSRKRRMRIGPEGMVLAVAAIILGITTRNLAAPSASLIYRPDLPLLY
jgi:hypothetical protein